MARQNVKGFSLIEITVAMVIFAVISSISYTLLTSVVKTRERLQQSTESIRQIQTALTVMNRDMLQLVNRPVLNEEGELLPAFYIDNEDNILEFTRAGLPNPFKLKRSTMQRVRYLLIDNTLVREFWSVLDRPPDSPVGQMILLPNVENITLELWQGDEAGGIWTPFMTTDRDIQIADEAEGEFTDIPAVRFIIETQAFGDITRIVPINSAQEEEPAPEESGEAAGVRP